MTTVVPVPDAEDLNWPMWLGPAPFHDYTTTITEWMHWRQIRDFSGGMLTDWGAHLLDTAQVANSAELSGPVEVEGQGEAEGAALLDFGDALEDLFGGE